MKAQKPLKLWRKLRVLGTLAQFIHKFVLSAAAWLCVCAGADEPAIRLVSPEDGAVFTVGESILLQAEPRGTQLGAIQKVEFVSRAIIGEATNAPFSFSWKGAPPGVHSISARATTAAGVVESWKGTIAVLPPLDEARVVHVDKKNEGPKADGSVRAPYREIQDAVDIALSGDTIKVAAGEYRGAVVIQEKNLRLVGGYTGASAAVYSQVGSGDFATRSAGSTRVLGEGADQVIDVDFNGSTQWSIIDGFTISRGKLGLRAHTYEDPTGKYFLLMDNTITANTNLTAAVAGVAISQVSAAVLNNTISSNLVGSPGSATALGYAGLFVDGTAKTAALVKGNIVEGNVSIEEYSHAAGIAFRGQDTSGSITRNIVRNNRAFYGAGIYVDGSEGSNFTRVSFNTVTRNQAVLGSGEFVDGGATAVIENEIIAWNDGLDGQFGGAFAVDSGPATRATLINCTIAYNTSYYDEFSSGNGLNISEGGDDQVTVELKNCIFWHNAVLPGGKEINAPGNGILKVEFSDVDELLQANAHLQLGPGNFRADPLFADPPNGDFHLKSKSGRWNPSATNSRGGWISDDVDSPCLDAGDPNSIFMNEPIPNGGRIDLGAWGNTAEASQSKSGSTDIRLLVSLLSGRILEISAAGPPGRYQLQAANSLQSDAQQTTWTNLDVLTNTTGTVIYKDITEPRPPHRFYRARLTE